MSIPLRPKVPRCGLRVPPLILLELSPKSPLLRQLKIYLADVARPVLRKIPAKGFSCTEHGVLPMKSASGLRMQIVVTMLCVQQIISYVSHMKRRRWLQKTRYLYRQKAHVTMWIPHISWKLAQIDMNLAIKSMQGTFSLNTQAQARMTAHLPHLL